jgi:hypothetical protein
MTIAAQLTYTGDNKEFQFRDKFVMPLLLRLGFPVVWNNHGVREFGRDVIFGDVDRFGHVVYYGMQVKYETSVSLSASHELIQDAEQATRNPFTHRQTGRPEYISSFYVANAGDFSDQARENFANATSRSGIRDARLLDGNYLLLLDKMAFMSRDTLIKERIAGLVQEIGTNQAIGSQVLEAMRANALGSTGVPAMRMRLGATETYLATPILIPNLQLQDFDDYWQVVSMANYITSLTATHVSVEGMKAEGYRSLNDLMPQLIELGANLEKCLKGFLRTLAPPAI